MSDIVDGESTEMQGSGKKPYVLKNIGGVYSCSCPAWRNQSASTDVRTCKHLIKLRGSDAERERLGEFFPEKGAKKVKARTAATKKKQDAAAKRKPPLLLAHSWKDEDPTGWWMSEKLDGVRAYWDGKDFVSRLGNVYHAPDWFKKGLPRLPLDGELFMGRGQFQRCVSAVRRHNGDWEGVKYVIFDVPALQQPFEDRIDLMKSLKLPDHVRMLTQEQVKSRVHFDATFAAINKVGGEGLMLRQPGSMYEEGRSITLLKVKTFHDAEATVEGHSPGKGRHKGRCGALECVAFFGTKLVKFSVGSGLSDKQRDNPPAVGTVITYRYQELTKDSVPRFPTFLRVREDV